MGLSLKRLPTKLLKNMNSMLKELKKPSRVSSMSTVLLTRHKMMLLMTWLACLESDIEAMPQEDHPELSCLDPQAQADQPKPKSSLRDMV